MKGVSVGGITIPRAKPNPATAAMTRGKLMPCILTADAGMQLTVGLRGDGETKLPRASATAASRKHAPC